MEKEEIPKEKDNSSQSRESTDSNVHLIQFDEDNEIEVNCKKRNILFIVLSIIATLSSLDGGIIPQQNEVI